MWSRIDLVLNRRRQLQTMNSNYTIPDKQKYTHNRRQLLSYDIKYIRMKKETSVNLLAKLKKLHNSNLNLHAKLKLMEEANRATRFYMTIGFLFLSACFVFICVYNKKIGREKFEIIAP